jgi:spectinomycin phosphotransferase
MAKPELPEAVLRAALRREFSIEAEQLEALSHGIDTEAAGLRVSASDGREWFAKLRRGHFAEIALALPAFLAGTGIAEVVAPIATLDGRRCASLGELELAVYPFVQGSNGLDVELSEGHWLALGRALRRIHAVGLPGALAAMIRRQTPTRFAGALRALLEQSAPPLVAHRERLWAALDHLERGLAELRARPRELVACHSDIHAGNLLLAGDGALAIVDWDEPILAPRERDVMFVGGGYYANRCSPEEERARFLRGYGEVPLDPQTVATFRCERVIEDVVLHFEEGTPESLGRVANILSRGGSLDRALG